MIITTTDQVPDKKIIRIVGIARGNTIRTRHVGKDILAGLKTLVGGEIEEYTKLIAEAREQALDRMGNSATEMGANAVINVRLATSSVMGAASEVLAYGTAVIIDDV